MKKYLPFFLLLALAFVGCKNPKPQVQLTIKWSAAADSVLYNPKKLDPKTESFRQQVLQATSDTAAINAMNLLLSRRWKLNITDTVMQQIITQVYEKSKEIKYGYGEVDALRHLGSLYFFKKPVQDSLLQLSLDKARQFAFKDLQVYILVDNAYAFSNSNRKEAISFLNEALQISQKLNRKDLMVRNFRGLAFYNEYINNAVALEMYNRALDLAREINDSDCIYSTLSLMSRIYQDERNYTKASTLLNEALEISIRKKDTSQIIQNLNLLSIATSNQKNEKAALGYLFRIVSLRGTKTQDYIFGNIADIYLSINNYDSAMFYYNKVISMAYPKGVQNISEDSTSGADFQVVAALIGKAKLFTVLHKYESALAELQMAGSKIFKSKKLETFRNYYYKTLADVYLHQKKYEKASSVVDSLISQMDTSAWLFDRNLMRAFELQSKIYDSLHLPAKAYTAYKKYIEAKDSLNTIEKAKQFAEAEAKANEKQLRTEQEKKNLMAAAELRKQKIIRNVSAGGAVVFIGFACFAFFAYSQKQKDNLLITAEKEKSEYLFQQSEKLLLNILPAEVAEELKAKGKAHAKMFDDVTILFTDFKSFTTISERLSPEELVDELNDCFSAFDEITSKYNIEKIKTVGDAYLAVSGLPTANPNHAQDIVKAAIEIRDFMSTRKSKVPSESGLEAVRIGIHSGSVVAGIVGVKKFAYDIWGDTVNTAARMEQNSEAGKINISQTTYELVKNNFTCTYRGEIEAKNKGMLKMYFVD